MVDLTKFLSEPEKPVEAPKSTFNLVDFLAEVMPAETPTPVSENPDRQFYSGSGASIGDRFPETTQPDFVDDSLNQILVSEGGFQDDKEDSGNYLPDGTLVGTNRGITPVALAEFKGVDPNSITVSDIRSITEDDARAIYRQNYFDKPKLGQLPQDLQASVFDMFINSGSNAIKILQKAAGLPESQQDGFIGPSTLAAVISANVSKSDYADARIAFYKELVRKKPKTQKYLNGWITRANKYR